MPLIENNGPQHPDATGVQCTWCGNDYGICGCIEHEQMITDTQLFPKIIEIELFISERQIFSPVMEIRRENENSIQFVNYPYPGQRKVLLPNVGQFDGFTLGPDIAEICRVLNWAQVKATDISFSTHVPKDKENPDFYRRGLRATLFDGNGGITLRTYGEFDIPGVNYDGQRLDAFLLKVVKELGDFEDAGGNY